MRSLILVLFTLQSLAVCAADVPEYSELLKKANAIRPPSTDFVWQRIPWQTEAGPALKAARAENRALLVWLAGGRDRDGSPLERC
jgi:hypothetical protein